MDAPDELPSFLAGVHSVEAFADRLGLHTGKRIDAVRGYESFVALRDWWARSHSSNRPEVHELRRAIVAQAPELERELDELRAWKAPRNPAPGTAYGELYANLCERWKANVKTCRISWQPPGPFDARHPGWLIEWKRGERRLVIEERPTPLTRRHPRLTIELPLASPTEPRFEDGTLDGLSSADAWYLHALRVLIVAMVERTDTAILALESDSARPVWDHLLERLEPRDETERAGVEWAFWIHPSDEHGFGLSALARRPLANGQPGKWQRRDFEAFYTDAASPLERDIARVALCGQVRDKESSVQLGTPIAHELLRLLAQHPKVHFAHKWHPQYRSQPNLEVDPRAEIAVGDLTMKMERAPNGDLAPHFFVAGKEVAPWMMEGTGKTPFRGAVRSPMIASAIVPKALRPWIGTALRLAASLAFPPEAVTKLVQTTEPLVRSGIAELPREALGFELPYAPELAVRVSWHDDGLAVLSVFVSVAEGAPFVPPGVGATLFTFEKAGRRVFVERDHARERALLAKAPERFNLPLLWSLPSARTESIAETLALAEWLERNPLRLAIEITHGKRPETISWTETARAIEVREEGSWLVLDGGLEVLGHTLTFGEVLEAARHALRFVRAEKGVFVELSERALQRLSAIAMAAELAPKDKTVVRLHRGFAGVLAEAGAELGSVRGIDLEALKSRFATRDKRLRIGGLESGKLRAYQQAGVAWMLRHASWAPGCVLADDMGLGKTVQTAAILKARAELGPQLVVAPASVTSNWIAELRRFVPSLRLRWLNDERDLDPAALGAGEVLVVSYGLLLKASLERAHFATLVVDEAQYVKNFFAQRTGAVRGISRDFTIALTGTPLENHLGELFSIVDLVFPGLLGSEPVFRERFRKPIETHLDKRRLQVLGNLLGPFLLRRTRKDVLEELPPREEITEWIDLSEDERRRYLALRRVCEEQFSRRRRDKKTPAAQLRVQIFAALTRLRQLSCDPSLVDPTFEGRSSKAARVVEIATELAREGYRAIVFSQFTSFLEKVRKELETAGLRVAYLAGDTPTSKRRAIVDAFQAGDFDVFCVSLLAGGTGLNLTRASYVIHTDPWWNPAVEEQAISRAHRMGQNEPVTAIRLVARGTIEEAVLEMHDTKKQLAEAVLTGKSAAKSLTADDLLKLLRFGG